MAKEQRLIDANALQEHIGDCYGYPAVDILHEIATFPTVDAVPVVHGRWLNKTEIHDFFGRGKFVAERVDCSACDNIFWHTSALTYNYCPNCGAKMDGGTDNERKAD